MYPFLVCFQLILVIAAVVTLVEIISSNPLLEGKYLFIALCGAIVHSTGYLIEITSKDLSSAMVSVKFQYLGLCFGLFMLLMYSFKACRTKLPEIVKGIFLLVNTITCLLVFTTDVIDHQLYYKSFSFETEGLYPHLVLVKGPYYYIHTITALIMIVVLVIMGVLRFSAAAKANIKDTKFVAAIIGVGSLSVIVVVLYNTGALQYYDPSSLLFVLMCIFIRFNIYDIGESAMQIVTESINQSIIVVDKNYMYIDCNPEAKKVFPELEEGNFERKRIGSYLTVLEDIFVTQSNHEFKIRDRFYRADVFPVTSKNSDKISGYAACITDCTQSHFHMRDIIEMKNKADNANRAKSEFLANVSHEIRTPMNSILGMAELALKEDMSDSVREKVGDIKVAGDTLLTLINDILDFSKIEANKVSIENVHYHIPSLIMDVTNIIGVRLSEKKISFEVDVEPSIPNILSGDEKKIKQILINLLGNAVKYTKEGSVAFILKWEQKGNMAILKGEVRDTGVGIRESEIGNLFQSFQRIDSRKNRSIEGAGLGLTITKKYLELMSGTIEVESIYGKGSSFFFTIPQLIIDNTPCEFDLNKRRNVQKTFVNSFFAPDAKILVVDDNQTNLKIASGFLKTYKIEPDTALSGKECLEMVEKKEYDIIFLDYMMPVLDGIDTLQLIRAKSESENDYFANVPVVALTADSVNGAEKKFMSVGFQGYISKPIDAEKLEDTLAIFIPPELVVINDSMDEQPTEITNNLCLSINGVDINEGIYNSGGNPDDYVEILKIFLEFGSDKMSKIKKHYDDKNIFDYTTEVHSLKSSSANIGAAEISALAKELEFAGKDKNIELIEEKTDKLLSMYSELLENIAVAIKEYDNR